MFWKKNRDSATKRKVKALSDKLLRQGNYDLSNKDILRIFVLMRNAKAGKIQYSNALDMIDSLLHNSGTEAIVNKKKGKVFIYSNQGESYGLTIGYMKEGSGLFTTRSWRICSWADYGEKPGWSI